MEVKSVSDKGKEMEAQKDQPFPSEKCKDCETCQQAEEMEDEEERTVSLHKCVLPECGGELRRRPDHYTKTCMYGNASKKGEKNTWISVEQAKKLGLEDYDPRAKQNLRVT